MDGSPQTRKSLLVSFACFLGYLGLLYGMAAGLKNDWFPVMSVAFLFLAPFATGALVNAFAWPQDRGGFLNLVLLPSSYSIASLVLAALFKIEGMICVVMALPFS